MKGLPRRQSAPAAPAQPPTPKAANGGHAAKSVKSPKGAARQGAPTGVKNVVLLGAERTVTVITARGSVQGPLNDFKALARKAGARGRTALIAPMNRTPDMFEGTPADLAGALRVQRMKNPGGLLGAILVRNQGRQEMLRVTPDGSLSFELATIRSAGLSITQLTGLIEAAARYNTQPQLIFYLSEQASTMTMAVNTPTYVDVVAARIPSGTSALDHMLTMTGTVITEQGLQGELTILLLGDLTGSAAEIQGLLSGESGMTVQTVALSNEEAARQLITHPAALPGSLGTLHIPLDTPSGHKDFIPHFAVGVPLALAAGVMFALATSARSETQRLNAATAQLEVLAQEAEALKASNDTLEANIAQARKLATDRGTLAGDLRDIALMLARNGARVDAISGPGAGSANSADFDGKTVRATYTLEAMVPSASAAEGLILDVNSGHYATNVQSVGCEDTGDAYPCRVDMQLGLTNPAPTPEATP